MRRFTMLLLGIGLLAVLSAPLSLLPGQSRTPVPPLPQALTVDLNNGVSMVFVLIPQGKFTMGSPRTERDRQKDEVQHEVEITKPFYLAKYPVTQEQYEALTGLNPSFFCGNGEGSDKVAGIDTRQFPVENVSWEDAKGFCERMTKNDKQKRVFRLPTEAEWEYACRAGTTTPFHFGSILNGTQANCPGYEPYGTRTKGPYLERTCRVGSYEPNKWGLYDMHGNVWQWCEDYYGPYAGLNAKDPVRSVRDGVDRRVLRGGSWYNSTWKCRAANRNGAFAPTDFTEFIGFRVAFRPDW